jgi:hypothetical protein
MILGAAQGCNQWNPYDRRRAAKAYETLVCHSSIRRYSYGVTATTQSEPSNLQTKNLLAETQHGGPTISVVRLSTRYGEGEGRTSLLLLTSYAAPATPLSEQQPTKPKILKLTYLFDVNSFSAASNMVTDPPLTW